jgi:hypothetical protein
MTPSTVARRTVTCIAIAVAVAVSVHVGSVRAQAEIARVELTRCPSELGVAVEAALEVELSAR